MTSNTRSGRFSKCLAYLLMVVLTNGSVLAESVVQAPATESQVDASNQILALPTGTRLRLVLKDGSEVTGTLAEKRADTVVIRLGGSSSLSVPRSSVATVSVLQIATTYSATGATDVDVLRQVVTALGIGKTIELRTTGSRRLRGRIQSIEQEGFTVSHGLRSKTDQFAYGAVSHVRPVGMRRAAKVGIAAGVAGGLLLWMACYAMGGCGGYS